MSFRREYSFYIGMPYLAPEQLSEVEFYKFIADCQWRNLAAALGRRTNELVNDAGERLYASIICMEVDLGHGHSLMDYQESDEIPVHSSLRFYAKQFTEGRFFLGGEKPTDEELAALDAGGAPGRPYVCMTNAMVARVAGNRRLKVFRPAGAEEISLPEMSARPVALPEHEKVQRTGVIEGIDPGGDVRRIHPVSGEPVRYPILLESDINGAGLLYFVRYVAMMNYGERIFLQERLRRPVSRLLIQYMATEHRRTFYFSNAAENDEVLIYPTVHLVSAGESSATPGSPFFTPMKFLIRHDLYRASDGELMAISLVRKSLNLPVRIKGLQAEADRLLKDPELWSSPPA